MKVRINANVSKTNADIAAWSAKKVQAIEAVVNESAINIQSGAKRRVKVDTGQLRASIAIEPAKGPGYAVRVGTKVKHGPYVEFGTGIFSEHPTIPGRKTPWAFPVPKTGRNAKNYKFIRFESEGKEYFLTRGSKAHPFLVPSAEEERPRFLANMRGALKQ